MRRTKEQRESNARVQRLANASRCAHATLWVDIGGSAIIVWPASLYDEAIENIKRNDPEAYQWLNS